MALGEGGRECRAGPASSGTGNRAPSSLGMDHLFQGINPGPIGNMSEIGIKSPETESMGPTKLRVPFTLGSVIGPVRMTRTAPVTHNYLTNYWGYFLISHPLAVSLGNLKSRLLA